MLKHRNISPALFEPRVQETLIEDIHKFVVDSLDFKLGGGALVNFANQQ